MQSVRKTIISAQHDHQGKIYYYIIQVTTDGIGEHNMYCNIGEHGIGEHNSTEILKQTGIAKQSCDIPLVQLRSQ